MPVLLYLLTSASRIGPCVLQSPHQCAHRNRTTGLPLSAASEVFGPSHSVDSIGNAGWPSRLEQVHVLVEAHDDRRALELFDLALQRHDRFRALALSGECQRLHFDCRAERDRQARFVIELARLQLLFDDLVGARGVGHRLVVALRGDRGRGPATRTPRSRSAWCRSPPCRRARASRPS